jgi:hypothetical protein
MIWYLRRIKHQLDAYIPNHSSNMDPSTVGDTELLCPADNVHDREKIAKMMRRGLIFHSINGVDNHRSFRDEHVLVYIVYFTVSKQNIIS